MSFYWQIFVGTSQLQTATSTKVPNSRLNIHNAALPALTGKQTCWTEWLFAIHGIDALYSQQLKQIAGITTAQIPISGKTTSASYNDDIMMYVIPYTQTVK